MTNVVKIERRRSERLPLILDHLEPRRPLTALALAWRIDVSLRTIYRDLAYLRRAGYRIDGSAGGGGGILLRGVRHERALPAADPAGGSTA